MGRNSDAYYKEDAKAELDTVYYPVQITEGYELARKVTEATSNILYTKEAKAIADKSKFDWSKSEAFQLTKQQAGLSKHLYDAKAKELMSKPPMLAETEQMKTIRELAPVWSQSKYVGEAKKLAEKYHITMDDQKIALALKCSQDVNGRLYKKGYVD